MESMLLPYLFARGAGAVLPEGALNQIQRVWQPQPGEATTRKRKRENAPATVGYVKRAINAKRELKAVEIAIATTELPYDLPIVKLLSQIGTGDTVFLRDGDRVDPTSVEFRLSFTNLGASSRVFRCAIVQWMMDDVPTVNQVFGVSGAAMSATTVYKSYNRVENSSYRILYDSGPVQLGKTGSTALWDELIIKGKTKKKIASINYQGTADDTGKGLIYLMCWSSATDAEDDVYVLGNCTVNFRDRA